MFWGFIVGLFIAWLLQGLGFVGYKFTIFMSEVFNMHLSLASYYIIFGLIGSLIALVEKIVEFYTQTRKDDNNE